MQQEEAQGALGSLSEVGSSLTPRIQLILHRAEMIKEKKIYI